MKAALLIEGSALRSECETRCLSLRVFVQDGSIKRYPSTKVVFTSTKVVFTTKQSKYGCLFLKLAMCKINNKL